MHNSGRDLPVCFLMVLGAVEGYGFPLQGKCLDRFDTDGLHQLGLKVFTDAHNTVTVEEGDRYPLRPPSYGEASATASVIHQFYPCV